MTRKKSDNDGKQNFDSQSESIDVFIDDPNTIEKKRRLAYMQAQYLLEYLEEQGKTIYRYQA